MNWDAIGAIGEILGALVVVITLGYLAVQIRQNTAQQKREETVSIQRGQNEVVSQMRDPMMVRSYAMTAEKGRAASPEDRSRAIIWVIQYLNHFQVVHDLYRSGALDEEQYQLWAGFAVSIIAPARMRQWWDEENGRLAFHSEVRQMIDQRLEDPDNPPLPLTEMWSVFSPEAWESTSRSPGPQAPNR